MQELNGKSGQDKNEDEGIPLDKSKRRTQAVDKDVNGEHHPGRSSTRADVSGHLAGGWQCIDTDIE